MNRYYQWDIGQRVLLTDVEEGTKIHFAHKNDNSAEALVVCAYSDGDAVYADIPNILMQTAGVINVYIYLQDGGKAHTVRKLSIIVIARKKPADYVYTETEVLTWESLDERIKALEAGGGTGGGDTGGGGTGGGLEPLIGTTGDITPRMVAEALGEGRPITLTLQESTVGEVAFNYFAYVLDENLVVSSMIAAYNGGFVVAELLGYCNTGEWFVVVEPIALKTDIPDKTEIAEMAAAIIDTELLNIIGDGEVSE